MNSNISILNIIHDTTVDGPGFRTAVYAAGCAHLCKGCHNPHSWNIDNGKIYSIDNLLEEVKESEFANVTFTGGDPFMQVEEFTELARRIKSETDKNIWCYTGYVYEQIIRSERLSRILPYIDILVDGRYVESLKDESLIFRGSSNQRLIDVGKSLKSAMVVIWNNSHCMELPQIHIQNKFSTASHIAI